MTGRSAVGGGSGRRARRLALALALLGAALPAGAASQGSEAREREGAETRAVMDPIFGAVSRILPYSLTGERFARPAHRAAVARELGVLRANASALERHGSERDASFAFLARSLARDARASERAYADGRYDEARFRFLEMLDDCIACHSRLPSDRTFPLGARFIESVSVQSLPPAERVRLEVATRQFDAALASYEALFASPDAMPVDFDLLGELDAYLEIAIRVKGDLDRPIRALERLAQRSDTPMGLREDLRSWTLSLRQVRERDFATPSLEEARFQVREAEAFDPREGDRRALIHYLAASSHLHRLVADRRFAAATGSRDEAVDAELAEAYTLLGKIESRVGRALWPWQAEHLLESAIRLRPGTPIAREALGLLEEFMEAGYSGSGGLQMPEDERARLTELRALAEGPPPADEEDAP